MAALSGSVDVFSGLAGAPPRLTVDGQIVVDGVASSSTLSVATPANWQPLPSRLPTLVAPRMTGTLTLWLDSTVSVSAFTDTAQAVSVVPNTISLLETQVGLSIDRYWPTDRGAKAIEVRMGGILSLRAAGGVLNMSIKGAVDTAAEAAMYAQT